MAQVNKYPNREAYAADARRSPNKSSVSHIAQNGALLCGGVNVVVNAASAGIGDLAVYDRTQDAIRFVKGVTLLPARLPAELVPVAVVYAVGGDKVHIVSLDNATFDGATWIRWAASYEVALSGFDLAAGGSFTLRIHTTEYSFTYPAGSTLRDIAAIIAANLPGYGKSDYGGWTAQATDSEVIMTSNTYSAVYAVVEAVSGCQIRRTPEDKHYQTTLTGVLIEGTIEYVRRKNSIKSILAGCNPERFLKYYSASGSTKADQTPGSAEIIRESVFTEADNPELVAAYPTYRDYLLGEHLLQYPAAYGALLRDGKANTSKIGRLRFTDIRSETSPCYLPAAAALEYGVEGLEAGSWWLPSVEEAYFLMHDRVSTAADRESDPVNRTLGRLGKTACYGTGYLWTSCEYNSIYTFVYDGGTGNIVGSSKFGTSAVRPVSIIHKQ